MFYCERQNTSAGTATNYKIIANFDELKGHLEKCFNDTIEKIEFEYAEHNENMGYDIYYVKVKFTNQDDFIVTGITNGKFE